MRYLLIIGASLCVVGCTAVVARDGLHVVLDPIGIHFDPTGGLSSPGVQSSSANTQPDVPK